MKYSKILVLTTTKPSLPTAFNQISPKSIMQQINGQNINNQNPRHYGEYSK